MENVCSDNLGFSGVKSTSYTCYYSNIYWLSTLYKSGFCLENGTVQKSIYIEGIGTKAGEPDDLLGLTLGTSENGIYAKTELAISKITPAIELALSEIEYLHEDEEVVVNQLYFDLIGFSRGAAAARYFANRIVSGEYQILENIQHPLKKVNYRGLPLGKIRFIGLFDTVIAHGSWGNNFNPHKMDTSDLDISLHPSIADHVFQIVAENECRYNFALNSVAPEWPELYLPGAHSDIGGGYFPFEKEDLYLSRPTYETVLLDLPGEKSKNFKKNLKQLKVMEAAKSMAPIIRNCNIFNETWFDDRMPQTRYGEFQKRNFSAILMRDHVVKNDWSKVALKVMLDSGQEAGVQFDNFSPASISLPQELTPLCNKAIEQGRAIRNGKPLIAFTDSELDVIARDYIHCSCNWGTIQSESSGVITNDTFPSEFIGFPNRPDSNWERTIYKLNGKLFKGL